MIGNILVIAMLSFYTCYILDMVFNKQNRKKTIDTNKTLEKLRRVAVKTVDEQKKFINLRYPKHKFKFNWNLLFNLLVAIIIFFAYQMFFSLLKISLQFWQAIIIIMIFPIICNMILKRFNVEKSDITTFFR